MDQKSPSRVFLAEPNRRFVLTDAQKFGKIEYLSDDQLNPFSISKTMELLNDGFSSKNFDPENDFLCMTGNTLILSYTLSIAATRFKSMKLLMFDSRTSCYCERMYQSPKVRFV